MLQNGKIINYVSLTPGMKTEIENMAKRKGLTRAGMIKVLLCEALNHERKSES